jgi:putative DNA primase/helicase
MNPGWDLADALAEGWTPQQVKEWARGRVKPWVDPGRPHVNGSETKAAKPNGHAGEPPILAPPPSPAVELIPAAQYDDDDDGGMPRTALYEQLGLTCVRGKPHPNLSNIVTILDRHHELTGKFWFDEFLDRVFSDWASNEPREWTDSDTIQLTLWIQRVLHMPKLATGTVYDAVIAQAHGHTRNEARDWLVALKWDGYTRVCDLMRRGFGADDSDYTAAVGRYLMAGMVKRVLEPGCKVDSMPVFEGEQGEWKSTALSLLGGKWFTECHERIGGKDFYGVLQGKMLVEISEMHALSSAGVETVKGIISCQVDRFREPYGRSTSDHPRQNMFCGTANKDDWNRDETGARRFFPIKCGKVSLAWIRDNRDQLFAEAVEIARTIPDWWKVPGEEAKRQQDARREHDSWEPACADYLATRDKVRLSDMLTEAVKVELAHQGLPEQRRGGRILRAMGWQNKVVATKDGSQRWWVNPGWNGLL